MNCLERLTALEIKDDACVSDKTRMLRKNLIAIAKHSAPNQIPDHRLYQFVRLLGEGSIIFREVNVRLNKPAARGHVSQ